MKIFYEKREHNLQLTLSHSLAFDAHMHESVEIVYLMEGTAHAFTGGVDCELSAGDFFVVFPNNVHYYDNCVNNLAVVAIIPLSMLPEFRSILTAKAPLSPLVQNVNPQAGELFQSVLLCKGKYKNEAVRGMLLAAAAMILEEVTLTDEKNSAETTIGAILEFCQNNYKEEISLEHVSESLGISKSHISHIFTNKIHMSFRDYINSLRLGCAIQLLRQGEKSITEIASESGFETIRTFNRAFRKKFDTSPLEYQKQIF